jgi:hypothetical protein
MNSTGKDRGLMDPIGKKKTAEAPVVPSGPSLAHDLEALRDCVLLRLETIEDLARRRCGSWSAEINRLEQALKERTDELEQERNLSTANSNGDEQSWRRMLSRLESDRKLLTEAWERLERERIDSISAGSPVKGSAQVHPPRGGESQPAQSSQEQRTAAAATIETGNPVAETILRQFQTLCKDVRRTTEARYATR